MTLRQHRLISRLLSAIDEYRRGAISLENLQWYFQTTESLLEGDVPRAIDAAVRQTEAELESARFYTVDVEGALLWFEAQIDGLDAGGIADS